MNIDIMSMMIGQKAGGGAGGKGLPAVTSADNGKHLEVVNGAWKVKNPNSTIVTLWEENLQAFTPNPQFGNLPCAAFLPSAAITTGETYYVLWEGKEYACVGVDMNLGALTGVALGNGGLLGLSGDTGEPFLIGYNPADGTCAIVTATEGSHKFGVFAEVAGGSGGSGGGFEFELLWTNTDYFHELTSLSLDFESNYKLFYIEYHTSISSYHSVHGVFVLPSGSDYMFSASQGAAPQTSPEIQTKYTQWNRTITATENSIYISGGVSFTFGCEQAMSFRDNTGAIPVRIYGIK